MSSKIARSHNFHVALAYIYYQSYLYNVKQMIVNW